MSATLKIFSSKPTFWYIDDHNFFPHYSQDWNKSMLVKAAPVMSSSSLHYSDVIMTTMASEITSLTVVYSTVYSDADQRKHQSSASLAFVWGIHRDRWIPRTKGQLRGKCFHLMTSSWSKGAELTHWPLGDFEGNFRWVIFDVIILLISCEIVLRWLSLHLTFVQILACCHQAIARANVDP